MEAKRLLFVVSEDWYFVSHRLHLGEAAVRAGYCVGVLTRVSSCKQQIERAGIQVIDWPLNRSSRNPFSELRAVGAVVSAMRDFKPDVIHAVALKPVLYSSLAAHLVGLKRRVFAMGGLGFVFASKRLFARLVRPLVVWALRVALNGTKTRVVLQNPDDLELLTAAGVAPERIRLIRGAGVDTDAFKHGPSERVHR